MATINICVDDRGNIRRVVISTTSNDPVKVLVTNDESHTADPEHIVTHYYEMNDCRAANAMAVAFDQLR